MTDKLGLRIDGVKTNKLSDLGSMGRPLNEEEGALIQHMVNNGYELFTKRCADGRGMSVDSIKSIAEGRVWTGSMAKELNLVDQLALPSHPATHLHAEGPAYISSSGSLLQIL